MCTVGMRGCECGPGGSCDAGLECHGPSSMCYEPGCTLRTAAWLCSDGMCFDELQCVDEFCMSSPGTSTTGVDSLSGTASLTDTTQGMTMSTTVEPGTTSTAATDESTTLQMTTTVETGDPSDTEPVTTGEVGDRCLGCLMGVPPPCGCDSCVTLAECIYDTSDVGLCCANNPGETVQWNDYVSCALQNGCAAVCPDPPQCG